LEKVRLFNYQHLIDGKSVESIGGGRFERISPAHDETVGTYADGALEDVDFAIQSARKAFDSGAWPRLSGAQRARHIRRVAELIERDLEKIALIEVLESGKPISQARDEIKSSVELWYYAATLSQHSYGDAHNAIGDDYLGMVLREPIGVVGVITPWNFPFLIASQKIPFAMALGCATVVKPSQLTSGTTVVMAELVREAGIPNGVMNVVTGKGAVGARLADHPDVDMITFTGSTQIGKKVMAAAAGTVKKVELELGGKNPQIVMADAEIEAAVDAVVFGVYFNQGECCNSGSRIIVQDSIADEFLEKVVNQSKLVKVGDPLDPEVLVGAIASNDQLQTIERYVQEGLESGAKLELGGNKLNTKVGRYFSPTVFAGVSEDMSIAKEEIFGPVLSVLKFSTLDDAIRIANSTLFGLSSGIWTSDVSSAMKFAKASRSGTVWVNCWMDGFPEMPFGGFGESGIGRELGRQAIQEFTETKTIAIHTGARKMWVK
jgi:betaine-aldehyde dehydrogenase